MRRPYRRFCVLELGEPERRRQSGGAPAHDQDVDVEGVTLHSRR